MPQNDNQNTRRNGNAKQDIELASPGGTRKFAVGEEVNADHCGSNLRMARPQATKREGASAVNARNQNKEPTAMLANGLTTIVGVPVRCATAAAGPGGGAPPPAGGGGAAGRD